MKFVDYLIAAALVGCLFLAYAGYRLYALPLLFVVAIVASWRFWDQRRADEINRSRRHGSGEMNPKHDEPMASGRSHAEETSESSAEAD